MAQSFTEAEWQTINALLDQPDKAAHYGIPNRVAGSVVMSSWNIRKFGALSENGQLKKSAGATDLIVRYCRQCDLIALQEVQDNTESVVNLIDRLNAAGGNYDVMMSDVTGKRPGQRGMGERFCFVYNMDIVMPGRLASDLTLDRTAVLKNINDAYALSLDSEPADSEDAGLIQNIVDWASMMQRVIGYKFKTFVQFVRSPHMVEFIVPGQDSDGDGDYQLYCINAHLVSGDSKAARQNEFFALLEWLLLQSKKIVTQGGKIYLLMADLNLDFDSSADKRRRGLEEYITSINKKRKLDAKVNFPFLDPPHFTNARRNQTFDHIAYIAEDERWPRGRHNSLRGTLGADQFDYGMFDFTRLFMDAGPGMKQNGDPDYDRFAHDFTDHMPIWLRMPIPTNEQHLFTVSPD